MACGFHQQKAFMGNVGSTVLCFLVKEWVINNAPDLVFIETAVNGMYLSMNPFYYVRSRVLTSSTLVTQMETVCLSQMETLKRFEGKLLTY